jgi:hypothetical protein
MGEGHYPASLAHSHNRAENGKGLRHKGLRKPLSHYPAEKTEDIPKTKFSPRVRVRMIAIAYEGTIISFDNEIMR